MSSVDNQRITSSFAIRMLQKEIANRKKGDNPEVAPAQNAEIKVETAESKESVPTA